MSRVLCALALALAMIACTRRELTYSYQPTVSVAITADWSDMSEAPTGMSIYCYPESGAAPTIVQTNNTAEATVSLAEGVYSILIFNQIPSDYGTVSFSGMDSFESASIGAISAETLQALKSDSDDTIRDPEEVAAEIYLGLEITADQVMQSIELKSKGTTKTEDLIAASLEFTPQVVLKTTHVKIKVLGVGNFYSATGKLYGMATGYNFSQQRSHDDMCSHLLEEWSSSTTDDSSTEGEISISFDCFGLPGQTSSSVVGDYAEWDGVLDLDITLVDQSTTISESITLGDKLTATSSNTSSEASRADDFDTEASMDVSVDISITSGYGLSGEDEPISLPDVVPAGSTSGGFDATVAGWGDEQQVDLML
ncbi:MAG: DUF5119 domain-containing protein [Rikenellaceae bacterium]